MFKMLQMNTGVKHSVRCSFEFQLIVNSKINILQFWLYPSTKSYVIIIYMKVNVYIFWILLSYKWTAEQDVLNTFWIL